MVCYLLFLQQLHVPGWSLYRNPLNAVAWFGCEGVLAAAQLYRYFQVSNRIERQQTKWIVFCNTLILILVIVASFFPILYQPGSFYFFIFGSNYNFPSLLIPLSFGIAILRYRLWDIDTIINKALVYGLLTALLAAVYVGLIIGLESLIGLFSRQSAQPLVIVVSTLAIAALFQPFRHSIQNVIDRRFYRRKYDAARTLEAFSSILRNEVDLATLREHLVVQETMQPTHVSLWLRPPAHHGSQWVPWRANLSAPSEDAARDER